MDREDTSAPEITYDLGLLAKSEEKWSKSAALRFLYGDLYREMAERMVPGSTLELGSGIGRIKDFLPGVVTSDLVKTPYVDQACSAYDIDPPEEGQWANILALDVLHHLCRPFDFFASASRTLAPGGRIILVEPAATPFGRLFYKAVHPEPIEPSRIQPPFVMEPDSPDGEFANMGMGVALFRQHEGETAERLRPLELRPLSVSFRDFAAYPLTGGYAGKQLAPKLLIQGLAAMEHLLPQALLRILGLRMVVALEKVL